MPDDVVPLPACAVEPVEAVPPVVVRALLPLAVAASAHAASSGIAPGPAPSGTSEPASGRAGAGERRIGLAAPHRRHS